MKSALLVFSDRLSIEFLTVSILLLRMNFVREEASLFSFTREIGRSASSRVT
jgi:hypothetical protein